MNNNEIQRYTSILLGKENVETLSDLQLLFNRYLFHIMQMAHSAKYIPIRILLKFTVRFRNSFLQRHLIVML